MIAVINSVRPIRKLLETSVFGSIRVVYRRLELVGLYEEPHSGQFPMEGSPYNG